MAVADELVGEGLVPSPYEALARRLREIETTLAGIEEKPPVMFHLELAQYRQLRADVVGDPPRRPA